MFINFFLELRNAKLPVSIKEYLSLMDAMDKGVADYSVDDFYYLSRAALVKDERNLDKFDRVFGTVFNSPSSLWSLGVTSAQVLFDGGRIQANVDFSRAGFDVAVANYRRVVLTAMQEVEDGISSVAAIDRAYSQAQKAIESNRRVFQIAYDRYQGGIANSQDVIIAQQSQLNSERLAAQLLGQRLSTSVFLIKALGGDWQTAAAP